MKKSLLILAVLLSIATPYVMAQHTGPGGTITFSGQIVPAQTGQQMTSIVPVTATGTDGEAETEYAVYSVPTGSLLASFTTEQAAQAYAAQVTPQVAYRSP